MILFEWFGKAKRKTDDMMRFVFGKNREKRNRFMKEAICFLILGMVFFLLSLIFGNGFLKSLCFLVVWTGGVTVMCPALLKKMCREKRERAEMELPDYMDRIALLLDSGMQLRQAMIQAGENREDYFSFELKKALTEEERTGNVENNLALVLEKSRMKYDTGGVGSFTALVVQNMAKGSDTLAGMLKIQAELLRKDRSNRIKRKGEEAAAYMLLPSLIVFIAIIVMMTAPVIMMLG